MSARFDGGARATRSAAIDLARALTPEATHSPHQRIATYETLCAFAQDEWARGAHAIADKVILLATNRATVAHAKGNEQHWLDLIHALEADLALIDDAGRAS